MSFAGLWASWRDPETQERVLSCAIIATADLMRSLHDRMPVILGEDAVDPWLDPSVSDIAELQRLLSPVPDDTVYAYPISRW